jgi:hypothetical protein
VRSHQSPVTCRQSPITSRQSIVIGLIALSLAAPAGAQSPARVSVDTVLSIDEFGGDTTTDRPNIVADISVTARLSDGWQVYVRPWFRQPRATTWDKQIYQAAFRYERQGPVMARVDAGYIASPVGLGMFDTRASINPTILPHFNYVIPMPAIDAGAPRVNPIAATYPLGGMLTLSTDRWDARAALVNSAPTRIFVINGASNPRATPVFEAGAGVTPRTGLRLGVSFAHGLAAAAEETTGPAIDRDLTLVGVEGEYSFAYTKLSGELIADRFTTSGGTAIAYTWFVEGAQTITPRWFVAARHEGSSAPAFGLRPRADFETLEATAGFRATTDITFRGSYFQRRFYGLSTWDNQAGVSIVWAHRWW